jgi:hypothetical protein
MGCSLAFNGKSLSATALLDSGANGYIFINVPFAKKLRRLIQTPTKSDFSPGAISGFSGKHEQMADILLLAHLRIQNRKVMNEWCIVLDMKYDVIIGRKWFEEHDTMLDVKRRRLLFPPDWLPDFYDTDISMDQHGQLLRDPAHQPDAERRDKQLADDEKHDQDRRSSYNASSHRQKTLSPGERQQRHDRIDKQLEEAKSRRAKVHFDLPNPSLLPDGITRRTQPPTFEIDSRRHDTYETATPEGRDMRKMDRQLRPLPPVPTRILRRSPRLAEQPTSDVNQVITDEGWDFATVSAMAFEKLAKKSHMGVTSLYEIDRYIQDKKAEMGLPEDEEDLFQRLQKEVPKRYHRYLDVFSKAQSDKLSDPRPGVDHKIDLDGHQPEELGYSPLYKMSLEEAEACKKYIVDSLRKGFITSSHAPWAAPILLVPKQGGKGLRFCVDYRKLNALTRKDRYPLPLIDETLSRIGKAKFFTKIDIRQAFHRIRLHPDAEELTTFRTRYGAYKYKVLPFGLTNGPSTFQRYINDILMGYLDDFCSAYIDDILIYSDTLEEHEEHVEKVLERLRSANLQADIDKCEFHVTQTKYLGFIIGVDGIAVDPDKIEAVESWEEPATVRAVQSFLGFCNFYRRFVENYGRIAKPLNALTVKGIKFEWSLDCQQAFDELKKRLLTAPVLRHFSYDLPTRLETDSSDGIMGGVLSQQQPDTQDWHPVGYFSETMQGAELNYSIQDKELMAVVRALQYWRAELIGLQQAPFLVITDHQALEHYSTKRQLNLRQAGWAELLAQYNFTITYRPGSQNGGADALSRKAEDLTTQKARKEAQRELRIFRLAKHGEETTDIMILDEGIDPPSPSGYELTDLLIQANKEDPELEVYREKARLGNTELSISNGALLTQLGRLVVSSTDNLRTRVIDEVHGNLVNGHPGRNKTRKLVAAKFWWPGMSSDIDRYVNNCVCRASKAPRDKTPGLLQPLPIPQRPWQDLAVDFKSMPKDKYGYDNILTIVDRLSKSTWLTPCHRTATSQDAARMYYEGPYRMVGLPDTIVSDRGSQFVSDFMSELSKIMGIKWKPSAPGHSQTAGQAEIINALIDQRLRMFINHYQDNWSRTLPALDYVQNGTPHESTGLQPHEVMMGFPMPKPYDWEKRTQDWSDIPRQEKLNRTDAQQVAKTIQGYVELARETMGKAQERMRSQANAHRREPDFEVGDTVRVLRKTYSTTTDRPSDKLEFPLTKGWYTIKEKSGHSFLLDLPDDWKGPKLFHADRLRKFDNNPLPGQACDNPGPEDVDGEPEWEVQEVLASKLSRGKLYYQVQWRGWNADETWYLAENFKNATAALQQYHDQNPGKAGPPLRLQQWKEATAQDEAVTDHPDDNKAAPDGGITRLRKTRVRK